MGSHFAAAHTEAFVALHTVPPIQSLKAAPVYSTLVTNFKGQPGHLHVFSSMWLTTYLTVKKWRANDGASWRTSCLGDVIVWRLPPLGWFHRTKVQKHGRSSEQGGQVPNILPSSSRKACVMPSKHSSRVGTWEASPTSQPPKSGFCSSVTLCGCITEI